MNYILFIDTSSNEEITVRLTIGDKTFTEQKKVDKMRAQAVLPMVDGLLIQQGLTTKDLTSLEVNPGPGSFTGLRVGVAIANTLATTLKIPLNGKINSLVEPIYA